MTTKAQQQNDMVGAFVASIPTMQTDIALLKQDTAFLKQASLTQDKKSDAILTTLSGMSVVSKLDFEKHVQDGEAWKETFAKAQEARFNKTEEYLDSVKPGIGFANALVSRWTTFLVLLLLTAGIVVLVGRFVPLGV